MFVLAVSACWLSSVLCVDAVSLLFVSISTVLLVLSICFIAMASNVKNNNQQPATSTFVIDNFSSCTSTTTNGAFYFPSNSNTRFVLCMNPNIDMTSTTYWQSKSVVFSICMNQSPNNGRITVRYRMSIVNAKGQKCNAQEGIIKFIKLFQFGGHYILYRDVLSDTSKEWLVNDTLTVCCEVYLIDTDLDEKTITDETIKPSTILRDYGSLFESGKLSDLVLVAGATEFKVHKTVLGARSPVFAAMFEHDTKEKQSNRIEVENVSGETYHELLRYIYTDKVENMKENALELMVAADKYQLDHLKSTCEQYLGANLTIESVAITLVMADLHRAEALKSKCIEYISKNGRKVKATEGWKSLTAKTELLIELFLHLSDKHSED